MTCISMDLDMAETGSIKFTWQQVPAEIGGFAGFAELNEYRRKLLELGMIGLDSNGVGFGNLSIRDGATSRFYITGSGTGGISELIPSHYARVVAYDFARNWLQCEGSTVASSESLTHAAVYELDPTVFSVIHCHDTKLWAALLEMDAPATPKRVEYGTPAMAHAVRDLFKATDMRWKKIFAMAGHEGGVVAFGRDPEEAFGVLAKNEAPRAKQKVKSRR
jgi:ribulose-5-phosphate 4-epimerase/fuculose-1-phosphate aldolase